MRQFYDIFTFPFTVLNPVLGNPVTRSQHQETRIQNISNIIINSNNNIKNTYSTILTTTPLPDTPLPAIVPAASAEDRFNLLRNIHHHIHGDMVKNLKHPKSLARKIYNHWLFGSTLLWGGTGLMWFMGLSPTLMILYVSTNIINDIYTRTQIGKELDHNDRVLDKIETHINDINTVQNPLHNERVHNFSLEKQIDILNNNYDKVCTTNNNIKSFHSDITSPYEKKISELDQQLTSRIKELEQLEGTLHERDDIIRKKEDIIREKEDIIREREDTLENLMIQVKEFESRIDNANKNGPLQGAEGYLKQQKKEIYDKITKANKNFMEAIGSGVKSSIKNIKKAYSTDITAIVEKHQEISSKYDDLAGELSGTVSKHFSIRSNVPHLITFRTQEAEAPEHDVLLSPQRPPVRTNSEEAKQRSALHVEKVASIPPSPVKSTSVKNTQRLGDTIIEEVSIGHSTPAKVDSTKTPIKTTPVFAQVEFEPTEQHTPEAPKHGITTQDTKLDLSDNEIILDSAPSSPEPVFEPTVAHEEVDPTIVGGANDNTFEKARSGGDTPPIVDNPDTSNLLKVVGHATSTPSSSEKKEATTSLATTPTTTPTKAATVKSNVTPQGQHQRNLEERGGASPRGGRNGKRGRKGRN